MLQTLPLFVQCSNVSTCHPLMDSALQALLVL